MKSALFFVLSLFFLIAQPSAWSGQIEISAGGSYNRSQYADADYSWTRRYGGTVGYGFFSDMAQIEFGFQDTLDRTHITNYEDTTIHDRVYSLTYLQNFLSKNSFFQPFGKIGIGQLNRNASGTYAGGTAPPSVVDSVTGVLGAGLRLYLLKNFAIRGEATSYLQGGRINQWKNNISSTLGVSYYF